MNTCISEAHDCVQMLALDPRVSPQTHRLDTPACTIGRARSCEIIIHQQHVSRLHACIERTGSRYVLNDTLSANGTFVNSRRIQKPHLLRHNDLIGLGSPAPLLRFIDTDQTLHAISTLRYDERAMTFYLGHAPVELTPGQFRLLYYLYQHAGEICTRDACARAVWGRDYEPGLDAGALDQAFNSLRRALRKVDASANMIRTRRGLGYILVL